MTRDCEHGRLARSCEICELTAQIATLTQERDAMKDFISEICHEERVWEEVDSTRDSIRHWEECIHCGATRNGNRANGDDGGVHKEWCVIVEAQTLLSAWLRSRVEGDANA